jgi:hypothetical protein
VSALLTWDSKVLTVVSILGGVGDLARERMQADGVYDEFIRIAEVYARQSTSRSFQETMLIIGGV